MTYTQFVERMREYAKWARTNGQHLPAMTDAWGAGRLTGLPTERARAYLDKMCRQARATRQKPYRKVFYTIGGAA